MLTKEGSRALWLGAEVTRSAGKAGNAPTLRACSSKTGRRMEPVYLTIDDVAKRYNVDGSTIYRWKKAGRFPLACLFRRC